MYRTNNYETRKNNMTLGLICESGIHLHMHWLDPLLFKHKSS
jgi:hypothetical protein